MNITRKLSLLAFAALSMVSWNLHAGNINANAARTAANNFIKQQAVNVKSFQGASLSDLVLTHTEASSVVQGANDYYAFNINGGGFILIAGEDRATRVLGYSDKGRIDFNNLPAPLMDLLNSYKAEIEFLQTYKGDDLVPAPASFQASGTVGPLVQTTWGQEMPYYLQCPVYQGEYCVVGCIATAMAQVMNYWQYPTSSSSISSYYCYDIGQTVQSLPATTFDYSLMLDSYCHWDWDNSQLIQDTYTNAQAQEVAKLGRYCGQAVQMGYSPEGSGAYADDQCTAMKNFGYSNAAHTYKYYNSSQWDNTLKTEIDAGRPILYSAADPSAGGHAFICDGYNAQGMFHFNMGWYGTCDGWYTTSALNMTHRSGEYLRFNSSHEIVYRLDPPAYCIFNAESLNANNGLMVLGESLSTEALNVTFRTSYNSLNVVFGLKNENGENVCTGENITLNKSTFEQGSTINGTLALPLTLAPGTYDLGLYYYTTNANNLTRVNAASGQLQVVGRLAKYNEPFNISDVTKTINYLLNGTYSNLNITDVTKLINYLLTNSGE